MMTAVRSDAATKVRHFRIIVVMGWITHAANMAGCHIPPNRGRLHRRLGSASALGRGCTHHLLVSFFSCVTCVDLGPKDLLPRMGARRTHPGKVGSARRAQEDRATRSEADGPP